MKYSPEVKVASKGTCHKKGGTIKYVEDEAPGAGDEEMRG